MVNVVFMQSGPNFGQCKGYVKVRNKVLPKQIWYSLTTD